VFEQLADLIMVSFYAQVANAEIAKTHFLLKKFSFQKDKRQHPLRYRLILNWVGDCIVVVRISRLYNGA